jgi:hypothetical protein
MVCGVKPKVEDIAVSDADPAMARFRALHSKLVRVPKKALDARLTRDKRRKAASES